MVAPPRRAFDQSMPSRSIASSAARRDMPNRSTAVSAGTGSSIQSWVGVGCRKGAPPLSEAFTTEDAYWRARRCPTCGGQGSPGC
jgi:hypothetical protein